MTRFSGGGRAAAWAAAGILVAAAIPLGAAAASPQQTIAGAARKVVKIHGAGGVRGLEAYQTGILVSPTGHIVTVMSTVLDSDEIDCVLDDGRRFRGTLVGADPRRELAVISIEGEELPAFTLPGGPGPAASAARIVASAGEPGPLGSRRASAARRRARADGKPAAACAVPDSGPSGG